MPNLEIDPEIKKGLNDEGFESETPDSGAAVLIGKKEEMPELLNEVEKKRKTKEFLSDLDREDFAEDISGLTYHFKRETGMGAIRGTCETSSIKGTIEGKEIILIEEFYPGSHGVSDLVKYWGQLDGQKLDFMEAKGLFFKYNNLRHKEGRKFEHDKRER